MKFKGFFSTQCSNQMPAQPVGCIAWPGLAWPGLVGHLLMFDEYEFVCIKAKRCRFFYKSLLQFIAYFRVPS